MSDSEKYYAKASIDEIFSDFVFENYPSNSLFCSTVIKKAVFLNIFWIKSYRYIYNQYLTLYYFKKIKSIR